MKIDNKLISQLIRAIRSQEEINNVLKYSDWGDSFYTHILCNELYYLKKIQDNSVQKRDIYEAIITNSDIHELDILTLCFKKSGMYPFNDLFIKQIQNDNNYEFKINNIDKFDQPILDYLVNAAILFQTVYLNYELPQDKLVYAEAITNSYLHQKLGTKFNCFVAEAIFSNYTQFVQAVIDTDTFISFYLQLVFAQNRKNLDRIDATLDLIKDNEYKIATYGPKVVDYLYNNSMFSITDFTKSVDISYNTAKKYLKNLVDEKILRSVKVGKHNAFIYEKLYAIWRN